MDSFSIETALLADLHPHPRNYRQHPDDQLAHICQSIREHGLYRNIVVARDNTILAGHGVVLALLKLGWAEAPVRRLPLAPDDPKALKVLTGDNELGHLVDVDDRALSELLKEIKDTDVDGLLGTGYDKAMLANLVMVTRPASEIADIDEAAEWVGMPEYDEAFDPEPLRVMVTFRNEADRQEFARILGLHFTDKTKATWWPRKKNEDYSSVKFVG